MTDREKKKLQEKNEKILLDMMKSNERNQYCADCKAKGPRWASTNLGVFLCMPCAGLHRKMGTHISKVKSITLDTWTEEQVEHFQKWGNEKANALYNPHPELHPPPTGESEMEQYIRDKYERKLFMEGARKGGPPLPERTGQPEFAPALATLREMGWTDEQRNREVLARCRGDVNAAIELLCSQPPSTADQQRQHSQAPDQQGFALSPPSRQQPGQQSAGSNRAGQKRQPQSGGDLDLLADVFPANNQSSGDHAIPPQQKATAKDSIMSLFNAGQPPATGFGTSSFGGASQVHQAPMQQQLGFPGQQQPCFPGQQQPGFPGQQQPGFPGQQQPGFPGQQQPGFPGQQQPGFSGQQQPGFSGQQQQGFSFQQQANYPLQQPFGGPQQAGFSSSQQPYSAGQQQVGLSGQQQGFPGSPKQGFPGSPQQGHQGQPRGFPQQGLQSANFAQQQARSPNMGGALGQPQQPQQPGNSLQANPFQQPQQLQFGVYGQQQPGFSAQQQQSTYQAASSANPFMAFGGGSQPPDSSPSQIPRQLEQTQFGGFQGQQVRAQGQQAGGQAFASLNPFGMSGAVQSGGGTKKAGGGNPFS